MRSAFVLVLVLVLAPDQARADRHVVERGETLEHVAATTGCSLDAIERANHLNTSLVAAGTVIDVPSCRSPASAPVRGLRSGKAHARTRAQQALDVIDGASWIAADSKPEATTDAESSSEPSQEPNVPWHGRLDHGEKLEAGDGYEIRRPARAYGAPHVIEHLRRAIADVRALYPDVHTLAIGDLSAEHGGKISAHRSHQSGLDVDVGFYFTRAPAGYPDAFAVGDGSLDFDATWALIAAFARSSGERTGVEMIFLDYSVQRRIYDWARAHGVPDDELDTVFQYPHGDHAATGLIRHWPNHSDHLHVRFKPGR